MSFFGRASNKRWLSRHRYPTMLDHIRTHLVRIEAKQSADVEVRQSGTAQIVHMSFRAAEKLGDLINGPQIFDRRRN